MGNNISKSIDRGILPMLPMIVNFGKKITNAANAKLQTLLHNSISDYGQKFIPCSKGHP
jgi:hypothetical protein